MGRSNVAKGKRKQIKPTSSTFEPYEKWLKTEETAEAQEQVELERMGKAVEANKRCLLYTSDAADE